MASMYIAKLSAASIIEFSRFSNPAVIAAFKALLASSSLLNKSANKTTDLQNILTYVSKSFANASEECKLAVYDADSQLNPLWSFSYSRNSLAASASLIEKFVERNDPRAPQAFLEPL